jgi:predicted PurR-regulated permease PerM/methylmalonyl-CoA mutase cobalamin-binding subunit
MAPAQNSASPNRFIVLATFCLVVSALYFAQEVLVPLALAILFTFLLTPLVIRLERLGIPRAIAATTVVLLGLCLIGVLAWTLSSQAVDLASQLPQYKKRIDKKISHLPFLHSDGAYAKLTDAADQIKIDFASPSGKATTQPIAVTVSDQSTTGMAQFRSVLNAVASPLATTFIVAVFVIFMLIRREDLRDRVIRLVGEGQLDITTKALSEAGDRISRYLLMQTAVNTAYGLVIGTGLWTIGHVSGQPGGFPDAPLWGLLCGLFRFIPYVGPWIGAFFPVILSIAVFPGAGEFVATISLFVCVEVLNNSAIEPLLYGSSTGLSAVAILAAAVFWSWLWGPIGLLLSTPLTACIVVIGKYVPQMKFFDILLGDEPPLPPPTRLYQRLLALDAEAAADVIDEYRKTMPLEELYDTVIIPALAMAEKDHHTNQLDSPRRATMRQSLRDALDDLGDRERKLIIRSQAQAVERAAKTDIPNPNAPALVDALPVRPRLPEDCTVTVLCLPAHDESDELVAIMITQLLEFRGYCASSMGQSALASEMLDQVQQKSADIILVSALPPTAITHARYLCKRLDARFPSIPIVLGLWIYDGDRDRAKERVSPSDHAQITTSLQDALRQINQIAQHALLNNKKADPTTSLQ